MNRLANFTGIEMIQGNVYGLEHGGIRESLIATLYRINLNADVVIHSNQIIEAPTTRSAGDFTDIGSIRA